MAPKIKAKFSEIVVKDNDLIEASYRLTLTEQRLVLCGIVDARENQRGLDGKTFATVSARRFVEMFPDANIDSIYRMLKDACDSLMRRQVTALGIDEETGDPCIDKVQWVTRARYVEKSGLIRLRFTDEMVPFITRLESHFTAYRLELVANLTSAHAIRLYELLVQYREIGEREFEIEELKRILGLEKTEYPAIKDFKLRVIDVAVTQINKHTDIRISYENIKEGRSVTGLLFTIDPVIEQPQKPRRSLSKKNRPELTDEYIEQNGLGHPGETHKQARARIHAQWENEDKEVAVKKRRQAASDKAMREEISRR